MGLFSFFQSGAKYFDKKIEPKCDYCMYGKRTKDGNRVLCEKRGLVEQNYSCKAFIYSPLKRIPVKQLRFVGSIADDELFIESKGDIAEKQESEKKNEKKPDNKQDKQVETKPEVKPETEAKAPEEEKEKDEEKAPQPAPAAQPAPQTQGSVQVQGSVQAQAVPEAPNGAPVIPVQPPFNTPSVQPRNPEFPQAPAPNVQNPQVNGPQKS